MPLTLFEKIWNRHVVRQLSGERRASMLARMDELHIPLTWAAALDSFQVRDRSDRPWIWGE